jgi:hypothetical protein
VENDELPRSRHGKGAEKNLIEEGEYGGGRGDAESERTNGH